ncbi:SDR family NAD(P)-dependent oxidoreductase, partial [Micromonospora sp. C31]|uniref:type I polyketide synthase n=1 Tax=Micromonospora sp. C31 TaxID=2824876 RepID=UPI001B3771EE
MSSSAVSTPDPRAVTAHLRRTIARLTGVDPASIRPDRPLREIGLDSAGVTTVLASLGDLLGRPVPTSVAWRHPTIAALAGYAAGHGDAPDGVPADARATADEPIAIIGLGCRLPGGIDDPTALWAALRAGLDAVGEVPADRWDADAWHDPQARTPGRIVTRAGAFLDDVAGFDAELFRIAPAEARHMDPQQRVALEVAWSALEDARLAPGGLAGSRTGVFLGAMAQEYHLATGADPEAITSHSAVGWDNSIIPARIAYALGLRGPVLAVATACSSSLTALHLAVQSLHRGESDLALAGGVNLMLHPHTSVAMSRFGGLSPDGRCRAFAADAAGYVRGEGCGIVVVRRLSDALRHGDRIYAVVRGSAVNSDGASNGITAPNPAAQVDVVRTALRDAAVDPADVAYVEAHGTGTPLGDPIEADALGEVFAPGRDEPLLLGSVKTNIGHLEPAAGVAGVIKTALALHHGEIPASLHFTTPNPHIDFAANRLSVVTGPTAWPTGRPRIAGVSSFGFGGTNSHVTVAGPPAPPRLLVALAGRNADELRAHADELRTRTADELRAAGPVLTGGAGPHRAFVAVEHPDQLPAALDRALAEPAAPPADRVAFFFSGHGAQWPGMLRDLLTEPAFRRTLDEADAAVRAQTGWSVVDELLADPATARLDRTEVVQPVLYAVHVALAALLRAWGITPHAVLGQSIGEVSAAVVSGALTVAEGAQVICAWSAVAARADGDGGLVVVDLGPTDARAFVARSAPELTVAAHLTDGQVCLAGPTAALAAAEHALTAAGTAVRRVRIDYPAHTPALAALVADLTGRLGAGRGRDTDVPLVSTVTGAPVAGTDLDAGYWARNMTSPMLVAEAARTVAAAAPTCLVEVSPHPVARHPLAAVLAGTGSTVLVTGDRDRPARWALEELAGALWRAGHAVHWDALAGAAPTVDQPVALVVTGHTPAALAANADRLAAHLADRPDHELPHVAYTSATRRGDLEHRAAVVAADTAEAIAALREVAAGRTPPDATIGRPLAPRPAFLFTGQGSQRPGMGRALHATYPVFRAAFDEVCAALDAHLTTPLAAVVLGDDEAVHRTELAQPALFALEVALYRLWESWGVRPVAVAGHSVGEIVAAHVAGILDLPDAARLVAARGRLMQGCRADGAMVSVEATEEEVVAALAGTDRAALAAVNGPTQCVLSGDADAVTALAAGFAEQGRRTRRLTVSHAFHSAHLDTMLDAYAEVVAGCRFAAPTVALVSSVTGQRYDADLADGEGPRDPAYWVRQVRDTVRFHDAVRGLADAGARVYLEVGPAAVLSASAATCLDPTDAETAVLLPSLRADRDEARTVTATLGALHTAGVGVDWPAVLPGAAPTDLPGYAFQRTRYWLDADPARVRRPTVAGEEELWAAVAAGSAERVTALLDLPGDAPRTMGELLPYLAAWRSRRAALDTVAELCYRQVWRPSPAPVGTPDAAGDWLVVALGDADPADVTAALAEAGATVHVAVPDGHTGRPGLATVLAGGSAGTLRGVVAVAGPDQDPARLVATRETLALIHALTGHDVTAPLWIVTRGAVRCASDDTAPDPAQAALWGLGHVLALEHPDRWGGLIDLPRDVPADAALVATLTAADEEHVALRRGTRLGRRLHRATAPAAVTAWRPRGTVLITGGSGALAGHLARLLAARGAAHLVLASRRGPDAADAAALRDELAAAGTRVTLARCDVTDAAQVTALVAALAADPEPLRAVVHTAGVVDDRLVRDLDPTGPLAAVAVKLGGALNLHAATAGLDLDAFVLFSSVIGVLGNTGQAGYAAANAAVDALGEARRAAGLPATTVAWGPWASGGMADGRVGAHLRALGLVPMPVEDALPGLDVALTADAPLVVARIDWPTAATAYAPTRPRRLLADLPEATPSRAPDGDDTTGRLRAELAALGADDRLRRLRDLVAVEAAAVLGVADPSGLDHRRGFRDLGLDSMMGVELARRVAARTGLSAPNTLTFDRPDITAVAAWAAERLRPDPAAPTGGEATVRTGPAEDPVAVVGVGLRMPGGAYDLDTLWAVLAEGRDTLVEVPADRFDPELLRDPEVEATGRPVVRHAALLDDVAGFDAAFFGISPREAEPMDPQHRLLLEVTWEALEHARIRPDRLRDSTTGVFVGAGPGEYGTHRADRERDTYVLTGTLPSFAAGRIAYHLGLQGPALSVDTACSSSLVAVHLAVESLRAGECDTALAAGVQVLADPYAFTALNRSRALAPDGRSKTFSADADGYGRGEGVGVLVLMRLSDATRQGHPVLGLLRGSAVNHDGASSGITAPNGTAQQRVVRAALAAAALDPADVDHVECHGTGTVLGDPIEVQALAEVYGRGRPADRPLLLGTAKSVIGHLESAAGIAGVCKVLASLRHQTLPATLRSTPRNPALDWDDLPVRVVDAETPWRRGGRVRRAGVSSFGLSGTNAHVVVEEAPEPAAPAGADRPPLGDTLPLVVSAKDETALRALAGRWAEWLAAHPDADLAAVARTAAARTPFRNRAALLAADQATAVDGLRALADGDARTDLITGTARDQGGVVFVFPGQGGQWVGMGAGLLGSSAVFAGVVDECEPLFAELCGFSVREVLVSGVLDRVDVVQPVLFVMGLGLVAVWGSLGVRPGAVVGHSQGEVVAAVVSGALSLADGCRVVAARSRAVRAVSGGGMALVEAPVEWVRERLCGGVGVAAVNTASSTVVSGPAGDVDVFVGVVEGEGVFCRRVAVDYASHSVQMDGLLPGLGRELASVGAVSSVVPFYSSVTGGVVDGALLDGGYWCRNLRETVRFDRALSALLDDGFSVFVEVSPHPVLGLSMADVVGSRGGVVVGSLARGRGGVEEVVRNVAQLFVAGHPVGWGPVVGDGGWVDLPSYVFTRERFWVSSSRRGGDVGAFGLRAGSHAWLVAGTGLASGEGELFTGRICPRVDGWLGDHRVFDVVVVPGTGLLDVALAAGEQVGAGGVEELTLVEPLVLTGPVRVQVTVGP